MCLSIPSKVVKIDSDKHTAQVDTMGVRREVGLDLIEDGSIHVGDYVLIHIGFVMNKIDEEDALESIKVYKEIIEKMNEEERLAAIKESDECPNKA
jgi:hydrogenase expression/formation protein HypC